MKKATAKTSNPNKHVNAFSWTTILGDRSQKKTNKPSEAHEAKKITLGHILSWAYGALFAFLGFLVLGSVLLPRQNTLLSTSLITLLIGLVLLIMSAVLLPPINKIFKDKLNLELSTGIKLAVLGIGLILVKCIGGTYGTGIIEVIIVTGTMVCVLCVGTIALVGTMQLILKSKQRNEKSAELKRTDEKYVKEIKCTCNECGKVWHYLEAEEQRLRTAAVGNALVGCGSCGNPFGQIASTKSLELSNQAEKLKKCPNCGSGNIIKTDVYYEKK